MMSQDMGQVQYKLTTIAYEFLKDGASLVCNDFDLWSKDQAEESIDHGDVRELRAASRLESSTFIMKVFTSICYLVDVESIKFISKIIHRVHFEVNVVFPIQSFKSELIQVSGSSQLLAFELFFDLCC